MDSIILRLLFVAICFLSQTATVQCEGDDDSQPVQDLVDVAEHSELEEQSRLPEMSAFGDLSAPLQPGEVAQLKQVLFRVVARDMLVEGTTMIDLAKVHHLTMVYKQTKVDIPQSFFCSTIQLADQQSIEDVYHVVKTKQLLPSDCEVSANLAMPAITDVIQSMLSADNMSEFSPRDCFHALFAASGGGNVDVAVDVQEYSQLSTKWLNHLVSSINGEPPSIAHVGYMLRMIAFLTSHPVAPLESMALSALKLINDSVLSRLLLDKITTTEPHLIQHGTTARDIRSLLQGVLALATTVNVAPNVSSQMLLKLAHRVRLCKHTLDAERAADVLLVHALLANNNFSRPLQPHVVNTDGYVITATKHFIRIKVVDTLGQHVDPVHHHNNIVVSLGGHESIDQIAIVTRESDGDFVALFSTSDILPGLYQMHISSTKSQTSTTTTNNTNANNNNKDNNNTTDNIDGYGNNNNDNNNNNNNNDDDNNNNNNNNNNNDNDDDDTVAASDLRSPYEFLDTIATLRVLGSIAISNSQLNIRRRGNKGHVATKLLTFPENSLNISIQNKDSISLAYDVANTNANNVAGVTLHQAFVRLANTKTGQEIFFVCKEGKGTGQYTWEFRVNEASAKMFRSTLSATFSIELILGDEFVENSIVWHMGEIKIDFSDVKISRVAVKTHSGSFKPDLSIAVSAESHFKSPQQTLVVALARCVAIVWMSMVFLLNFNDNFPALKHTPTLVMAATVGAAVSLTVLHVESCLVTPMHVVLGLVGFLFCFFVCAFRAHL